MIIEKSVSLAARCSSCGSLDINQLNIFQLSGGSTLKFTCQCGRKKIKLTRKDFQVLVNSYCLVCDTRHEIAVPEQKFWSGSRVGKLQCPRTGLNLGYFGPYFLLQKEVDRQQRELELLADGLGFDDFVDPEIMLMTLDILHDFAAAGSLNCECGSSEVNIDLFSDHILLTCQRCQGLLSVPACSKNDLNSLQEKESLLLSFPKDTSPPRTTS